MNSRLGPLEHLHMMLQYNNYSNTTEYTIGGCISTKMAVIAW